MIVITGATGKYGQSLTKHLLNKTDGSNLRVVVRDPSKVKDLEQKGVDVKQGDYDNVDTLIKAFSGADKLFFISANDIKLRAQQHKNVVNAAIEAGVKHVFYTSFQRKNESESSPIATVVNAHVDTEAQLKESGLAYTILRNNLYADLGPEFIGENILQTKTVFLPTGEGKAAFVTRDNMAEASANLLLGDNHQNKIYDIANNEAVSFGEIAVMIGKITSQEIQYVSPTADEYAAELGKAGVPKEIIGLIAGFSEAIKQNEFDQPDSTLESILGRKPDTMLDYLKSVYTS